MKNYLGAILALLLFFVTGFVPSLVYGGYMGMMLNTVLFGVTSVFLTRLMIGGGMILGFLATLFLYLVLGTLVYAALCKLASIKTLQKN